MDNVGVVVPDLDLDDVSTYIRSELRLIYFSEPKQRLVFQRAPAIEQREYTEGRST